MTVFDTPTTRNIRLNPRAVRDDRRGTGAILLAMTLPVLIMGTSLAVDMGTAYFGKQKLQTAADATVLAVAKRSALNAELSEAELDTFGRSFLQAQLSGIDYRIDDFTIDVVDASASLELTGNVHGALTRAFGESVFEYAIESAATFGRLTIEVALVLDNTRSIDDFELAGIKQAGNALLDELVGGIGSYQTGGLKVAVLPFTGGIRLPEDGRNAWWMDRAGVAPNHFDHIETYQARDSTGGLYDWRPTRFELFDLVEGVEWAGCVESRPYPHDVLDTPPDPNDPETLFLPYFAFDVEDGARHNDWIDDHPPSCRGPAPVGFDEIVANTCKYGEPANPGVYNGRTGRGNERVPFGPNLHCQTPEILPLSTNIDQARAKLAEMTNEHHAITEVTVGVAWAWRVLSPEEPFTEGGDYHREDVRKVMVLMTDGQNWLSTDEGLNYTPWGFPGDGRLAPTITNSSSMGTMVNAMNDRTIEACENAKAAGIEIIAVNFGARAAGQRLLGECASSTSMFFNSASVDDLIEDFAAIGRSLGALRLVQ